MPAASRPSAAFALPVSRAAKARADLIEADDRHFRRVGEAIAAVQADLTSRLEAVLRGPAGSGQEQVQRDSEACHLRARARLLGSIRLDTCIGRMVPADGGAPVYVGRIGLKDPSGEVLLVDWRSKAAEPFFAATRAEPMGLRARRRYRWSAGRVVDYWDETLGWQSEEEATPAEADTATLDAESAFLDSLGAARGPRMRDVLATLATDQDAIIRAHARGPLLVDGGPGTGKTVVALHRAAYLVYHDVRLRERRGGMLFIGPHQPYLDYVADLLPGLGEDDVRTCTLRDLVARLKADARMLDVLERAVGLYEEPPTQAIEVETPWGSVRITRRDWADAFAAARGTAHNLARDLIWQELAQIVADELEEALGVGEDGETFLDPFGQEGADGPGVGGDPQDRLDEVAAVLRTDRALAAALAKAWPLLGAQDIVADLWEVPAYLRRSAPWTTEQEAELLARADPRSWTEADLPLLDAARGRLGDPDLARRLERGAAARAEAESELGVMLGDMIAADSSDMKELSMLHGADMRAAFVAGSGMIREDDAPDALGETFAHVVIDEAQELGPLEWAMVLRRCPTRSLTIVGDRAQAGTGWAADAGGRREGWEDHLARVGLTRLRHETLSVNYRTPAEVMAAAAPVIQEAIPDANVPESIREADTPVRHGRTEDLDAVLEAWLRENEEGVACVISAAGEVGPHENDRIRPLTPMLAKGLEFDLVVLVEPRSFGDGILGAVARYVAMTRATQELVVLEG
jgi:hypothetical protein